MAYTLTNNSAGRIVISDNRQDGLFRDDIKLDAGQSVSISDDQFSNFCFATFRTVFCRVRCSGKRRCCSAGQ